MTTTDTEVVAAETERERKFAYVSRRRMWRTLPEPSSDSVFEAVKGPALYDRWRQGTPYHCVEREECDEKIRLRRKVVVLTR